MKRIILLLLVILSTTTVALAVDVSVTANLVTQTSSKLTYSIDVTEVNIDLMSFEITYDSSALSLSSVSAGSQLISSDIDANINSRIVLIDIPGFDGKTVQGDIAIVELDLLDATGNRDIGVMNVDIIPGGSGTVDTIQEDTLASSGDQTNPQDDESEDESTDESTDEETTDTTNDTTTPAATTQKKTTTQKKSTTQQTASGDEEPESDNSILMYSLIAVGALVLIVGGFVAWNKFKKPKEEIPIHETTPLQQPDQPTQPTQPQQPQTPPTDQSQQPDQPTQ